MTNKSQYSPDFSYSTENAAFQQEDSLLSAEIKADPVKVYFINYVRKSSGSEALLVSQHEHSLVSSQKSNFHTSDVDYGSKRPP